MIRTIDIVMIGLVLGGAAFTFKIKQDSETSIDRVTALQKKITLERDAIDVLQADWSLLTDPKRLQELADRYQEQLRLEPTEPTRIGEITDIPTRPLIQPPVDDGAIADLLDSIQSDVSINKTGSITSGDDQ